MEEIKNKVYELEGLLELASLRKDKQQTLWPLIEDRIKEITKLWTQMSPEQPSAGLTEVDNDVITVSESLEVSPDDDSITITEPLSRQTEGNVKRDKLKLCLNDRFRYARIFTGGDNKKLDAVLERLAIFADVEEAREYLLSEYDLDPEDAEVSDFFDLLTAYYS